MPDTDKPVRIRIIVSREQENGGAQAVARDLNEVKQAAGGAGKSVNELGEAHQESSKHASESHENHRALHALFRMLGKETVPEFGHALHALTMGPLGAVVALGAALEIVSEHLSEASEHANKLLELNWESQHESVKSLAESYDRLEESLKKASEVTDPLKHKHDADLAVLNATAKAHKEILEAMEKEELAAAGGDKSKEDAIRQKYAIAGQRFDTNTEAKRIAREQLELSQRINAQSGLESAATDAAAKVASAAHNPQYNLAKLQNEEAMKEGHMGSMTIAATRVWLDQHGGAEAVRAMKDPGQTMDLNNAGATGAKELYDAAQANLQRLEQFEKNEAYIDSTDRERKRLESAKTEAEARAAENRKAITEETGALSTSRKTFRTGLAGDEIGEATALSLRAKSGEVLNPAQLSLIQTVGTMVAGQNVDASAAEKMFQAAAKSEQIRNNFIERLMNAIGTIPNFDKYEARIRALEDRARAAAATDTRAAQDSKVQGSGS